jgi:hypothetical protein
VDEAGHEHGAASPEYAAAAARADRELAQLLARVDLTRDVVLVTADHGHSDRGGHGGPAPEVATVLTCYAGAGVRATVSAAVTAEPAALSTRSGSPPAPVLEQRHLGPLLTVLAGLPFPRHMQPGWPDLLWQDLGALPAPYLEDRRAAMDRFATASTAADVPGQYVRARRAQVLRGGAALLLLLASLLAAGRLRGLDRRRQAGLWAWMALVVAAHVGVYTAVRGSFDMTSINQRADWIRVSLAVGLAVAAGGVLLRALVGGRRRLAGDQLTLVALGAGMVAAHVAAFGWVLGFPLPGATLLFLPFFGTTFVASHAVLALATALAGPGPVGVPVSAPARSGPSSGAQ